MNSTTEASLRLPDSTVALNALQSRQICKKVSIQILMHFLCTFIANKAVWGSD